MKPVTYTFNPWNSADFDRESGHLRVWASVFSSSVDFTRVSFIFDTGAFITVLSRKLARQIGLPLKGVYTANLTGLIKSVDQIWLRLW